MKIYYFQNLFKVITAFFVIFSLARLPAQSESEDYLITGNHHPEGFTRQLQVPSENGGFFGILSVNSPLYFRVKTNNLKIFDQSETALWTYETSYQQKTYYNPVIRINQGDSFHLKFVNQLTGNTIIHWHGLLVDSRNDGLPQYEVGPNAEYAYQFRINNRGGTYWYHPHAHQLTGEQTYQGLAGFMIIEDDQTRKLNDQLKLKLGVNDIPLLIQDKRFDREFRLIYNPNFMEKYMGYYVENILINYTPKPFLDVEKRIYRFRILNGSNGRTYKLALIQQNRKLPFHIIGTDGGLLDKPYSATEVFISTAERVELLVDFSEVTSDEPVFLKSLPFDPMHREEMSMMHSMENAILPEGSEYFLLKLNIKKESNEKLTIPAQFEKIKTPESKGLKVRKFKFSSSKMRWYINGLDYRMGEFPVTVKKNTREIWELSNVQRGMPHPMHLHGFQFQVLERQNSPVQVRQLSTDKKGRLITDLGFKDTVLVWPGETVRIVTDFTSPFDGNQDYLFHCHILEHEDLGMMINYRLMD